MFFSPFPSATFFGVPFNFDIKAACRASDVLSLYGMLLYATWGPEGTPRNSKHILIYNIATGKVTGSGELPSQLQTSADQRPWDGSVIHNGKFYSIPHHSKYMLIYDIATGKVIDTPNINIPSSMFGRHDINARPGCHTCGHWHGAAVLNGVIYGIPSNSKYVLMYNTTSSKVTGKKLPVECNDPVGGWINAWAGGAELNGIIYFIPSYSPRIVMYNTASAAFTQSELVRENSPSYRFLQWEGGFEDGGNIYGMPSAFSEPRVLKYEPSKQRRARDNTDAVTSHVRRSNAPCCACKTHHSSTEDNPECCFHGDTPATCSAMKWLGGHCVWDSQVVCTTTSIPTTTTTDTTTTATTTTTIPTTTTTDATTTITTTTTTTEAIASTTASIFTRTVGDAHDHEFCCGEKCCTISTFLTAAAKAGDMILEIHSNARFKVSDAIQIGATRAGTGFRSFSERNIIAGFGSIILSTPLEYDHPAGTIVVRIEDSNDDASANADESAGGVSPGIVAGSTIAALVLFVGVAVFVFKKRQNANVVAAVGIAKEADRDEVVFTNPVYADEGSAGGLVLDASNPADGDGYLSIAAAATSGEAEQHGEEQFGPGEEKAAVPNESQPAAVTPDDNGGVHLAGDSATHSPADPNEEEQFGFGEGEGTAAAPSESQPAAMARDDNGGVHLAVDGTTDGDTGETFNIEGFIDTGASGIVL